MSTKESYSGSSRESDVGLFDDNGKNIFVRYEKNKI